MKYHILYWEMQQFEIGSARVLRYALVDTDRRDSFIEFEREIIHIERVKEE